MKLKRLHIMNIMILIILMIIPVSVESKIYDPSPADGITFLSAVSPGYSIENKTPLILIHGIHGIDQISENSIAYWQNFISYFNSQSALTSAYKLYIFDYESDRESVKNIARSLRNKLDDAIDCGNYETCDDWKTKIRDVPFVIVAHSMGGLVGRSYMQEHSHLTGHYGGINHSAGPKAGERILKLVTLATPHHGSPGANDAPRIPFLINPAWRITLEIIDALYWKGMSSSRWNRSDLRFDNYFNMWGSDVYTSPNEKNDWLIDLNYMIPAFNNKIIAHYGSINTDDILWQYLNSLTPNEMMAWYLSGSLRSEVADIIGLTRVYKCNDDKNAKIKPKNCYEDLRVASVIMNKFYYFANDGLVPVDSGRFFGHGIKTHFWKNYDHADMKDGKVINGENPLFNTIKEDLTSVDIISSVIAQTPMSGFPGASFVQWGTDFTPDSSATLHFQKPDGIEYLTQTVNLDANGHFETTYTVPSDKAPGVYTWWAVDDTTGVASNKVSYSITSVPNNVSEFQSPLDQGGWSMTQDFGVWNDSFGGYHLGEDYVVSDGAELPVYAAYDGVVKHAQSQTAYGYVVVIEHDIGNGDIVSSVYGHLRQSGLIGLGNVSKGQIIGYLSANSTENGGYNFTHLHFGIRSGAYSTALDSDSKWRYRGYSSSASIKDLWYDPSEFISNTPVYDHGNDFPTATSIAVGGISHGYMSGGSDRDYFQFTVSQPAPYVIYSRGPSDPEAKLYDENYKELARNEDNGEEQNFRIEIALNPGTYYVAIYGDRPQYTGPYDLHIEGVNDPNQDSDIDDLPDFWELNYWDDLSYDGLFDNDKDGLTNAEELFYGTDPTKSDTDGDGSTDKQEIEAGSDPSDPDWRAVDMHISLSKGFNLIGWPATVSDELMTYELLSWLGSSDEIDSILIYDKVSGRYKEAYYEGTEAAGENAPVKYGDGIIVYSKVDKQIYIQSTIKCNAVKFRKNTNLTTLPCVPADYSSYKLLLDLTETTVSSVQHFNPQTGMFEVAGYNNGQRVGVDFPIKAGEGYIIHMKQDVDGFQP